MPQLSYEIFRIEPQQLELLVPIFDKYRQFYNLNSDLPASRAFLRERLTRKESVVFAARLPDIKHDLAAFTQLYPSFSSLTLKPSWILYDLFVDKDHRRRNLGRALLKRATEFAQESSADGLTLKTSVKNLPAQRLYESHGWTRDEDFYSYDYRLKL